MYQQYQPQFNYSMNQMFQQPQNNLLRVNGIDGARAYQMAPNSTVALFDNNEDIFYVKSSDAGGFANIKAFQFNQIEQNDAIKPKIDYVTRKEFDELKEIIKNGKFTISKSNAEQSDGDVTTIPKF